MKIRFAAAERRGRHRAKYAGVTEWQGFFDVSKAGSASKNNPHFSQSRNFEARTHGQFTLKRSSDGWDLKLYPEQRYRSAPVRCAFGAGASKDRPLSTIRRTRIGDLFRMPLKSLVRIPSVAAALQRELSVRAASKFSIAKNEDCFSKPIPAFDTSKKSLPLGDSAILPRDVGHVFAQRRNLIFILIVRRPRPRWKTRAEAQSRKAHRSGATRQRLTPAFVVLLVHGESLHQERFADVGRSPSAFLFA